MSQILFGDRPFSFAVWHDITPGWSGRDRADAFSALPEGMQEQAWRLHAESCERISDLEWRDARDELLYAPWPPPRVKVERRPVPPLPSRSLSKDELLALRVSLASVPADEFVEALAGVEVPVHRMLCCPLPGHDDRSPSFRVYDHGWACFGCGRGGEIFQLAGWLWEMPMPLRGSDFVDVLKRLAAMFGEAR